MVIGSGDAGIENALGLAGAERRLDLEPQRRIRARQGGQCRPADGGHTGPVTVAACETRIKGIGRLDRPECLSIHAKTRDGEQKIKCDRIIARMGSSPPRNFVEGAASSSPARTTTPIPSSRASTKAT